MSFFDKIKRGAKILMFAPQKPKTVVSQTSVYPKPADLNENQIPDMLEQKQARQKVNLLNPAADAHKNITRTKDGRYVPTLTYPLPPVAWENRQFEINKKKLNDKNRFFR